MTTLRTLTGSSSFTAGQVPSVAQAERALAAEVRRAVADGKVTDAEAGALAPFAAAHAAALAFQKFADTATATVAFSTDVKKPGGFYNRFEMLERTVKGAGTPATPAGSGGTEPPMGYRVRPGDTLTLIATSLAGLGGFKEAGFTPDDVMYAIAIKNGLSNVDAIGAGEILEMPTLDEMPAPGSVAMKAGCHWMVRAGQTLEGIAWNMLKAAADEGRPYPAAWTTAKLAREIASRARISNPDMVPVGKVLHLPKHPAP